MKDRTEHIRAIVEQYEDLTFIPLRIEDAFSRDWWDSVGGKHISDNLGIDLTNEDLLLSSISNEGNEGYSKSPVQQLQKYIFSLPTQTAILSTVQTLTRILLLHTASAIGSSHLLLGTSLTSLSISLISSISQGGGFVVREEGKEEWVPPRSVTQMKTNGHENGNIRVVRPLQDIGMKECAMWAWWHGLNVVGREKFPGGKQSIGQLTKGETSAISHPATPNEFLRLHCWARTRLSVHGVYNSADVLQVGAKARDRWNMLVLPKTRTIWASGLEGTDSDPIIQIYYILSPTSFP
ncbi:hypothetical protein H2248_008440 [Termitomyces sp. 'cryptogamus']|nr:hypothetical protein H2248_008440 [Termitomyces sp. 'cryptogamus']